jgi:hypothetical protein
MAGVRVSIVIILLLFATSTALAQPGVPSTYHAISNRNIYAKPAVPPLGPAGWRFTDPTFVSRMLRVTDSTTRPGFPGRSYSTPSAAHQLAWNATSDRFYIRSLDGWFIPYNFDPITMTASRIQPTSTGNGGLLVSSQVEPQFSFLSRDIIYGSTRDQSQVPDYPVVHQFNFATGQYTTLLNLRTVTDVAPDTYAGALSSSATSPEKVSIMFGGPGQDSHFKVAVFQVASPTASVVILNTRDSQITVNGGAPTPTSSTLGFLLHHAWIDQAGQQIVLYPVGAKPSAFVVWNLATHTFTYVTTLGSGHDALGFGWQVNQDSPEPYDGAQWQLRSLASPNSTSSLIAPPLSPRQPCIADHTSWNNAQPGARLPVLSSLYRYTADPCPLPPPWRTWDDEIVAIQTSSPGNATVWRFAHHRSRVAMDTTGMGSYFWYQPHAVVSPNGRWALFTSNWEKTLGLATNSEPEGLFRTDVFIVRLMAGAFTDTVLAGLPIRAIHFTELRDRIDLLRLALGLGTYAWNDPGLGPGFAVRAVHLLDLRIALTQAYAAAGRQPPNFSEVVVGGATMIRGSQIEELRTAVINLEGG